MRDRFYTTERFSAGYDLIPEADVIAYNDDEAIMDQEMFEILELQYGRPPIGFVDGLHYHFRPEKQIPSSSVAVPQRNHDDPSALLVQR